MSRASGPRWAVWFVILTIVGSACAQGVATPPESQPNPPSAKEPSAGIDGDRGPLEPGDLKAPPPVTIHYGDRSSELNAWTYCYSNGCADGAPPENPIDVGNVEEVLVDFPLEDWTFRATFSPAGERCGRDIPVRLENNDDGLFVVEPAGYSGTYDVTLFGRGNGDLFVTFRWTTPRDGVLPEPKARLALVTDHDGEYDSYGTELMLTNLRATPRRATAVITTAAANGRSHTLRAKRAKGCWPEGTVYWNRPDTKEPAHLGDEPFTYEVVVELDGKRYEATAVWPDDEIQGNEPSVALEFSPELPGLEPR